MKYGYNLQLKLKFINYMSSNLTTKSNWAQCTEEWDRQGKQGFYPRGFDSGGFRHRAFRPIGQFVPGGFVPGALIPGINSPGGNAPLTKPPGMNRLRMKSPYWSMPLVTNAPCYQSLVGTMPLRWIIPLRSMPLGSKPLRWHPPPPKSTGRPFQR